MSNKRASRLSWWEARHKMAELNDIWSYSPGDEVFVRALRRGKVDCQHRGCGDHRAEVPLKDVLKGLQKLKVYPDVAIAEYEITEVRQSFTAFGNGSLRMLTPLTSRWVSKETVRIKCPELVWQDLHKDLMLWEMPNGVSPGRRKRRDDRDDAELGDDPEDKDGNEYPSYEVWGQVDNEVDDWIESGRLNARGQKAKLVKKIDSMFASQGLSASESTIKRRINWRITRARRPKRQFGSFGP
jgi:hypothetical protein